ncbi:MAG: TonB-dependent receptor [Sphingobacteriia bacterium]|jgi:iron complex outermembrane receptor protein
MISRFFVVFATILLFSIQIDAKTFTAIDKSDVAPLDKGVLKGNVLDAVTGKPLLGASVFLHEAKLGVVTAVDGSYTTPQVPAGKYLVEVSFMGYKSFLETIEIGANTNRVFKLAIAVVENEAVTVTGVASAMRVKQSAQPVSIVKKGDLLATTSTNIIDALSRIVPGVAALSTGPAISKPIIRGLGYNRIITINDGVRQEGQQWGDEHGIEIDESSVQKIEVLKGPASLLYGSDGMGGVINIISNAPVTQGTIKGNLNAGFLDNNGLISTNANLAGHLNNGFNWNVYGSAKSAKDYQNKFDGRVLNSRFNEQNFGGYVGVNRSWGYSHLMVSNFNQSLGLIEGERDASTGNFLLFAGTPLEKIANNADLNSRDILVPGQKINHFKIASDNNFAIGANRLILNIGYQRNQRKELGDPFEPTKPGLYFDLQTVNYNVQFHLQEKNGWKTAVGVNGMFQQNKNRGEEVLIPEYQQFDAGAFVYTRKTFNNNLTISGGLRGDFRSLQSKRYVDAGILKFNSFNKNFGNFSGSVGLSYNASEALTIKANLSRGYRAPSVSELSSNGTHEGTNRYEYGDQNLKTETSLQFDAGIELNTQHVSFMFNAFYNNINNYIFYSKLSNKAGGDSLVNVDGQDIMAFKFKQSGAALYGFETKLDIHPHPLDWLHFSNTFSMVAGKFNESFEGVNRLPFIPPARLLTELRGDFKKAGNTLRNAYVKVEMDNVSTQNRVFTAYDTETATEGYTLLNFAVGTDFVQKGKTIFSLHLALNNFTDVAYQNHLSRLKYAGENLVTGRTGVFNMGRNLSVKLNVPLDFREK